MRVLAIVASWLAAVASAHTVGASANVRAADLLARQTCHELPVVVVAAQSGAFPDATCNQLRFPAEDCLKSSVTSEIRVVDHADGSPNCLASAPTSTYEAKTNYRGQSSLFFPKHQIGVKFKADAPLLGFPEDTNFVFNGPYPDCTLIRNQLAYWLYRSTGRYASRTKHVALYFSDRPGTPPQYLGIYVLLEKVGFGPNRVNLAKMNTKCRGNELNGGWSWHNDPASYGDFAANMVVDMYQNEFGMGERPILAYPSGDKTSQLMRDYFVNTTTGFLPQLYRYLWENMTDPDGIDKHIDVGSFADYLLHTEMSLNVDAYRRSTYFFKDRDQPINAGPVWDFDLAYGSGARRTYRDWIFPQYTYWKRLMCNYKLTSLVIQRWKHMRSPGQPWSDESIVGFIDESSSPIYRQLQRCQGDWRSAAPQCASVNIEMCNGTYEYQIEDLKASVLGRAKWMDEHITQLYKKLDGKTCSFVGSIPEYNCAANGNDGGCLTNPEAYYNAVQFPSVRKPYSGPECGANPDGTTKNYPLSDYEKPSTDHCWFSSGVKNIYPKEKGVRDKTLTPFCNGYGNCLQGPGAKCECHKGVELEPESCTRIDDEYRAVKGPHVAGITAVKTSGDSTSPSFGRMVFVGAAGVALVGVGVLMARKLRQRHRHSRLRTYRPLNYGSTDEPRHFYSPRHV